MRDIVIANKNKYIYNGKLYDDISIKRVISKEIELYVMEEDLLIKTYDEIKNDKEDIVYEIINEEYGSEKSALMIRKEKNYSCIPLVMGKEYNFYVKI